MKKIKSIVASALVALIVLASLGFGVMIVGFAVVIGAAFALAIRLGAGVTQTNPEPAPTDERGDEANTVPA